MFRSWEDRYFGRYAVLRPRNSRTKDVGIFSVVVPKLEFSDVQMKIFLANLVIDTDDSALEDRPEARRHAGQWCDQRIGAGNGASSDYSRDMRLCREG
jgi:hypothetical protein